MEMKSRPCETAWQFKSAVEVGDGLHSRLGGNPAAKQHVHNEMKLALDYSSYYLCAESRC
jgi:hypothetical protein